MSRDYEVENYIYDTGYGEVEGNLIIEYSVIECCNKDNQDTCSIEFDSIYYCYIDPTTELEIELEPDLSLNELQQIELSILEGL